MPSWTQSKLLLEKKVISVCNVDIKEVFDNNLPVFYGDEMEELRDELARHQEKLIQALLLLQEAPCEVDAEQVAAQANSLAAKRRRAIERCHPELEHQLGEVGVRIHICEYFKQYPSAPECAFEDGTRFINWLEERGVLKPNQLSAGSCMDSRRLRTQGIALTVIKIGLSLKAIFLS